MHYTMHLELDELKNWLLVSIARTRNYAILDAYGWLANHLYINGLRAGSA